MIAALFVESGGAYYGLEGVDPWDKERDARLYNGTHAVVAHPPCERWGRYWYGGPMRHKLGKRYELGDDGGCFAAALAAVRKWGGVLEHPEGSHAWRRFGLITPLRGGGWSVADDHGGWTCCVEQGNYGHLARKATWLYAAHVELPVLIWPRKAGDYQRLEPGFHSSAERKLRARPSDPTKAKKMGLISRMSSRDRAATPVVFRNLLLSIARSAVRSEAA